VQLVKEIRANQSDLPANTAVLIADVDTDMDIRKEYGVTMKHTAVYFDANGEHVKNQPGVQMDDILAYLLAEG